jgi:hypothetical protein
MEFEIEFSIQPTDAADVKLGNYLLFNNVSEEQERRVNLMFYPSKRGENILTNVQLLNIMVEL